MRQQVVGFCELYMLVMGSWSVMGGSTLKHPPTVPKADAKIFLPVIVETVSNNEGEA